LCRNKRTPIVREAIDHSSALKGANKTLKVRRCRSNHPGTGKGRRKNPIPQIANPIVPKQMKAIPAGFRIAGFHLRPLLLAGDYASQVLCCCGDSAA